MKIAVVGGNSPGNHYLIVQNGIAHVFVPLTKPSSTTFEANAAAILSTLTSSTTPVKID